MVDLIKKLDDIADSLENKGHYKLAAEVDVLANTIEAAQIYHLLNKIPDNIKQEATNKYSDILKDVPHKSKNKIESWVQFWHYKDPKGLWNFLKSHPDAITRIDNIQKIFQKIKTDDVGPDNVRDILYNQGRPGYNSGNFEIAVDGIEGGYTWVYILDDKGNKVDYSYEESCALEHCGTATKGHLLSLRDPSKKSKATAELSPDGTLHQLKFKGNKTIFSKELHKYWFTVISLLNSGLVKKIDTDDIPTDLVKKSDFFKSYKGLLAVLKYVPREYAEEAVRNEFEEYLKRLVNDPSIIKYLPEDLEDYTTKVQGKKLIEAYIKLSDNIYRGDEEMARFEHIIKNKQGLFPAGSFTPVLNKKVKDRLYNAIIDVWVTEEQVKDFYTKHPKVFVDILLSNMSLLSKVPVELRREVVSNNSKDFLRLHYSSSLGITQEEFLERLIKGANKRIVRKKSS